MSEFIPIALACGHVLEESTMFEVPAVGSGEAELAQCPNGCGMVEYVLPPEYQGRFDRSNLVELDLGYVEAGAFVTIDVCPEDAA